MKLLSASLGALLFIFFSAQFIQSSTITVSKDGTAMFSSIQSAINSAHEGDIIIIKDFATYNEQVTINSNKTGISLRSENPNAQQKPVILWKDTINVNPKTTAECNDTNNVTYIRNGALRLINTQNIVIEGIIIDGGAPFVFQSYYLSLTPFMYGNSAVVVTESGNSVIRNCEMRNAYFGLSMFDRNKKGAFYSSTIDPSPLRSADLSTGGLTIEKNRFHDNSWGINLGQHLNRGSTIRYNLLYKNYHLDSIVDQVKVMPRNSLQTGGAIVFTNVRMSPFSIYNNTFWNNYLIFAGDWNVGTQHLIFNNIYSKPQYYWSEGYTGGLWKDPDIEIGKKFPYRMKNCVFSAQQNATETGAEGSPYSPYSEESKVIWFETPFLSLDPSNPDFLKPDWNNADVKTHIKNRGWPESGIKNSDGSVADLGAISSDELPSTSVSVIPNKVSVVFRGKAYLDFTLQKYGQELTNIRIVSLRYIEMYTGYGFENNIIPIPDSAIFSIPVTSMSVAQGRNEIQIDFPYIVRPIHGFFELTFEATGAGGTPVICDIGHLPLWYLEGRLDMKFLDLNTRTEMIQIQAGQPFLMEIEASIPEIGPFTETVYSAFGTAWDGSLRKLSGEPCTTLYITEKLIDTVMLTKVSAWNFVAIEGVNEIVPGFCLYFQGNTIFTKVIPAQADTVIITSDVACVGHDETSEIIFEVYDKFGNSVSNGYPVSVKSLDTNIVAIDGASEMITDTAGRVKFIIRGKGLDRDTANIVATVISTGKSDTMKIWTFERIQEDAVINYPKNSINIKFSIEVFDLRGRIVHRLESRSADLRSLQTSRFKLSKGTYMIKATDIKSKKVMKNRILNVGW